MRYFYLLFFVFLLNCSKKKSVQLPEIKNAKVTEVLDVSPAYIFYDTTQPDSTLFNRKNIISTTNWLVNVDKRLTLKQIFPHIQYLQNKRKKASMHKNDEAKNYFTCNDTSIKNLGFLEFTEVSYKIKNPDFINFVKNNTKDFSLLHFYKNNTVSVSNLNTDIETHVAEHKIFEDLKNTIKNLNYKNVILLFDESLDFETYIFIKSEFKIINSKTLVLHNNEYIF